MKGRRFWSEKIPIFYVAELRTKKTDWGYTTKYEKAIELNEYWMMRFKADCKAAGVVAEFIN